MDIHALLPKDKHDDSTIPELLKLTDAEITPIMPELLTWVQDINWPVSGPIKDVINGHFKAAEPFVLDILRGSDEVWKYNVISELITYWEDQPTDEIIREIARIAWNPTPQEIEDEVDKVAVEFMNLLP